MVIIVLVFSMKGACIVEFKTINIIDIPASIMATLIRHIHDNYGPLASPLATPRLANSTTLLKSMASHTRSQLCLDCTLNIGFCGTTGRSNVAEKHRQEEQPVDATGD